MDTTEGIFVVLGLVFAGIIGWLIGVWMCDKAEKEERLAYSGEA